MTSETWIEWSPRFAGHVRGRYTRRTFDEDGLAEEQKVEATCGVCGTWYQRTCSSGQVRQHIAKFGVIHAHRDPLAPLKRAGS